MPQFFESAVMTNAGASLLARAMAEGIAIDFKSIVVGDGSYTNEEKAPAALKQRTALKSLQVAYEPSSLIRQGNAVRLSALITNVDPSTHEAIVTSGFYINEIGIMAQPSDEATAPILFSISVTVGTMGDYMPAYTGDNPAQIVQGYVTAVSNDANVTLSTPVVPYALAADLTELAESKGQPNGIATLDSGGRIPYSQLPESAMEYKGTWNASTNTPTITEGVGTNGDFYIVSVAGTWNGQAFSVDDRIIFDGALEEWHRLGAGSVIDNLNSTSSTSALSANQGRVLNEKISNIRDIDEAQSSSLANLSDGWHHITSTALAPQLPIAVPTILNSLATILYRSSHTENGNTYIHCELYCLETSYFLTAYVLPYFNVSTDTPSSDDWQRIATGNDIDLMATKVQGGTMGHFASLDFYGDIADSGKKASDFEAAMSKKTVSMATVIVTLEDNTKYTYTGVSTLNMTGANVNCIGTVTFGSSTPTVSVSGFVDMDGDDITSAAASETWEFNVLNGRCLWKNWG